MPSVPQRKLSLGEQTELKAAQQTYAAYLKRAGNRPRFDHTRPIVLPRKLR